MSFPTELSNAIDGVTEIVAAHLNNLEAKVGIDNSAVVTSLDYLLKNAGSIDPGHKHTAGALSGGNNGDVFYKASGAWGPGTPDAAGLVAKSGDQSIAGVKTFTSIPLGPGSNPTTANQLARKAYVDLMLPLAGGTMAGKLEVVGSEAIWPLFIDNTNATYSAMGFKSNGTIYGYVGNALGLAGGSATDLGIRSENGLFLCAGGARAVTILTGGNTGIKNTSPGYLLTMEASGGGYYSASDHSWHNGSSIRWKENSTPIAQAMDLVRQLTGVRFNWKNSGIPGIGLIAEDVLKIVPEVVSVDKENPTFCNGINYGSMIGLLIEAIKDQQFQIEGLKAKLT